MQGKVDFVLFFPRPGSCMYIYLYLCMYIYACMHACISDGLCLRWLATFLKIRTYIKMCACARMYVYMYIYRMACAYGGWLLATHCAVYVYIYILFIGSVCMYVAGCSRPIASS